MLHAEGLLVPSRRPDPPLERIAATIPATERATTAIWVALLREAYDAGSSRSWSSSASPRSATPAPRCVAVSRRHTEAPPFHDQEGQNPILLMIQGTVG